MFWARIISLISPFAIFVFLSASLREPGSFFYFLGLSVLLCVLTLWLIFKASPVKKQWPEKSVYFFYGTFLIISSQAFFAMLENFWFKIGLLALTLAGLLWFFNHLFKRAQARALSLSAGILPLNLYEETMVFLAVSSLFGLRDFASYRLSLLLPILLVFVFCLTVGNLYLSGFSAKKELAISIALSVMSVELFWALSALSLAYYLKGLLFAFLYLFLLYCRLSVTDPDFRAKRLRVYLIISLIAIAVVLFTAKWF